MSSGAGMTVVVADCIEHMRTLDEHSIDAVVCDPPYALSFMGKAWDRYSAREFEDWCASWAAEALRVLKPGGHLLAFGGSRTVHRLASGIEDAGFEIRDCLAWMYGSGFPKSLDVSKAIDKAAGVRREVVGRATSWNRPDSEAGHAARMNTSPGEYDVTVPATPEAEQWDGWGTALKPAFEPVVVARKPLVGTVAANVLLHGTGALNIDGCRIATGDSWDSSPRPNAEDGVTWGGPLNSSSSSSHELGRWPANVVLDEVAADLLDEQTGEMRDGVAVQRNLSDEGSRQGEVRVKPPTQRGADVGYGGSGGASRFFYCAKASRAERNAGLSHDGKICSCRELEDQALSPQRDTSGPIEAGDSDCSTIGNGSSITDRSLMDSRSTTSTRTRPTTGSKTSRSSAPSITSESTAPTIAATPTESGSDSATSVASGSHQPSSTTTSAEKAGLSTADADRATSRSSSEPSSSASNACPDCGGVIEGGRRNVHPLEPTVKPVELMRWLIRLVTPPGGTILDPFTGSGTTGIAAHLEGFEFLGIEREPEYAAIARARIEWWRSNTDAGAPTDAVLKVERDPAQLDLLGGEAA